VTVAPMESLYCATTTTPATIPTVFYQDSTLEAQLEAQATTVMDSMVSAQTPSCQTTSMK